MKKLLILDDNDEIRRAIARLMKNDCEIEGVSTLKAGLAAVEMHPDLLVSDWNLENGIVAMSVIQRAVELNIPVILHSAADDIPNLPEVQVVPKMSQNIKQIIKETLGE